MTSDSERPAPLDTFFGFSAVRPSAAPASDDDADSSPADASPTAPVADDGDGQTGKEASPRPRRKASRRAKAAKPEADAPADREFTDDLDIDMDSLVGELAALRAGDVVRPKMPAGTDKCKKTIFVPARTVRAAEAMARDTGATANSLYYLMFLAGADAIARAYGQLGCELEGVDMG